MIVDSSAIVAVLQEEDDAAIHAAALRDADATKMSAATYVELINVLDRRIGIEAVEALERLMERVGIEVVDFTADQAQWARHARLTFGAGRNKANLNFGDCFSYALARAANEPLLFKGNDFALTDVNPAV